MDYQIKPEPKIVFVHGKNMNLILNTDGINWKTENTIKNTIINLPQFIGCRPNTKSGPDLLSAEGVDVELKISRKNSRFNHSLLLNQFIALYEGKLRFVYCDVQNKFLADICPEDILESINGIQLRRHFRYSKRKFKNAEFKNIQLHEKINNQEEIINLIFEIENMGRFSKENKTSDIDGFCINPPLKQRTVEVKESLVKKDFKGNMIGGQFTENEVKHANDNIENHMVVFLLAEKDENGNYEKVKYKILENGELHEFMRYLIKKLPTLRFDTSVDVFDIRKTTLFNYNPYEAIRLESNRNNWNLKVIYGLAVSTLENNKNITETYHRMKDMLKIPEISNPKVNGWCFN